MGRLYTDLGRRQEAAEACRKGIAALEARTTELSAYEKKTLENCRQMLEKN